MHRISFRLLCLACLLGALAPAAVRAGSITRSSVWNRQNALDRAREQIPPGAKEIRQRCEEIGVGFDNFRYRCTVWFTPAEDGSPVPSAPTTAP